jgi:hypothetical protein
MAEPELIKCTACNGRGYHRCECWPADCICGGDGQNCENCYGDGWLDPSYDEDWPPADPTIHTGGER